MSQQLSLSLAQEFPEYYSTQSILKLAAQTWPRFGLSAGDLAEMDSWSIEVIRAIIE
jgi:hypothetical protein